MSDIGLRNLDVKLVAYHGADNDNLRCLYLMAYRLLLHVRTIFIMTVRWTKKSINCKRDKFVVRFGKGLFRF